MDYLSGLLFRDAFARLPVCALDFVIFNPVKQAVIHIALLTAALLTLGIHVRPSSMAVSYHPALTVFRVLTAVIGLPYLALSATTPLLDCAGLPAAFDGRSAYRLFALSNLASLLALASYPLLIEPRPDHEPADEVVEHRVPGFCGDLRSPRLAGAQTRLFPTSRNKPSCLAIRSHFGFCWPWAAG